MLRPLMARRPRGAWGFCRSPDPPTCYISSRVPDSPPLVANRFALLMSVQLERSSHMDASGFGANATHPLEGFWLSMNAKPAFTAGAGGSG